MGRLDLKMIKELFLEERRASDARMARDLSWTLRLPRSGKGIYNHKQFYMDTKKHIILKTISHPDFGFDLLPKWNVTSTIGPGGIIVEQRIYQLPFDDSKDNKWIILKEKFLDINNKLFFGELHEIRTPDAEILDALSLIIQQYSLVDDLQPRLNIMNHMRKVLDEYYITRRK